MKTEKFMVGDYEHEVNPEAYILLSCLENTKAVTTVVASESSVVGMVECLVTSFIKGSDTPDEKGDLGKSFRAMLITRAVMNALDKAGSEEAK